MHWLPGSLEQALDRFEAAWIVSIVAVLASAAVSSLHRRALPDEGDDAAPTVDAAVLAPSSWHSHGRLRSVHRPVEGSTA